MKEENKERAIEHDSNTVWQYGKSPSLREASTSDMHESRKAMIRFALDHNIRDIRTYEGYKGDLLLEITTTHLDLLPILKAQAESLGMQTVIKERHDIQIHEIYCIMPDENVYQLKL